MFTQRPQTSELRTRRIVILFTPGGPSTFLHGSIPHVHPSGVSQFVCHSNESHLYNLTDCSATSSRPLARAGPNSRPVRRLHLLRRINRAPCATRPPRRASTPQRTARATPHTAPDHPEGTERLERPLHVRDVTFKRAPRTRPAAAQNLRLSLTHDPA
jgi:hypothetical protein